MKTLKQLLEEKNYSTDTLEPDDLTHWNEIKLIQSIVKEWLEQKRQNLPISENQPTAYQILSELLKELKQ